MPGSASTADMSLPMPRPGTPAAPAAKPDLHPRNRHRGRYDLPALSALEPALTHYLRRSPIGELTVDFADPAAVKLLNRALLRLHYGVRDWDIPPGYLCPPIPGRVDYLHYLADLLAAELGALPRGPLLRVLDIGTGANLVYPLLGQHEYGWSFVGTDIDAPALANAARILQANPQAADSIRLCQQNHPARMFTGVVAADEHFALSLCNPPFHASLAEAEAGTARKWRGLATTAGKPSTSKKAQRVNAGSKRNFGGTAAELACPGGELAFVERMIEDSITVAEQIVWFSCLISKASNLPALQRALQAAGAVQVTRIAMAQGQKQSRILAWSFLSASARKQALRAALQG